MGLSSRGWSIQDEKLGSDEDIHPLLGYLDIQYVRDTIKETLEAEDIEYVRSELEECLKLLEEVL